MQKSLKMLFETQVKIAMILIDITTCLGPAVKKGANMTLSNLWVCC